MIPHPDKEVRAINCAVITVSDTRSEETDRSGAMIKSLLSQAHHQVKYYTIIKDEPTQIIAELSALAPEIEAVIINGGTGIAPRDTTYDALSKLLEKTLPGFGEIFRYLSYQEIGSRAIASRAVAGIYAGKVVFSLPGSTNAVKLAMEEIILPELVHLVKQMSA